MGISPNCSMDIDWVSAEKEMKNTKLEHEYATGKKIRPPAKIEDHKEFTEKAK